MEERHNEFSRNLGRLITHLNRLRKRFMAERLRGYGLSGSMYMFINSLERNPGISQDFLVERFFMDKGNVARGAKKLEELGYIRREIDSSDRRRYNLFLTEEGHALVPVIRKYLTEWSELISKNFTDEERETAIELLDRMVDNSNDAVGK